MLGPHARPHGGSVSLSAAHQFIRRACRTRGTNRIGCQLANSHSLNLVEFDGNAHQHPDERRNLNRGVPAFNVVTGIGLGHANFPRTRKRLFER